MCGRAMMDGHNNNNVMGELLMDHACYNDIHRFEGATYMIMVCVLAPAAIVAAMHVRNVTMYVSIIGHKFSFPFYHLNVAIINSIFLILI
jgi:hypothetical protein